MHSLVSIFHILIVISTEPDAKYPFFNSISKQQQQQHQQQQQQQQKTVLSNLSNNQNYSTPT